MQQQRVMIKSQHDRSTDESSPHRQVGGYPLDQGAADFFEVLKMVLSREQNIEAEMAWRGGGG